MACLDTTFLLDLLRERKRGEHGAASRKLVELDGREETPTTTLLNVGELLVAPYLAENPSEELNRINELLEALYVLPYTHASAAAYGRLKAGQRATGAHVGDMDTLIASVAMEHNEVLITRSLQDFGRIPGLRVEGY